jgi:hypothetical protein
MSKLKASEEFVKGKHGIGYVSSDFNRAFKDAEFSLVNTPPTFQKLPRSMNDAEIESELKPGICTLGDVVSFMENPPEGTKDGYYNLFYTPAFVVRVRWGAGRGVWRVFTWGRGDGRWGSGSRVFSPATVGAQAPCHSCCSCALTLRLSALEKFKERVEKVLKLD